MPAYVGYVHDILCLQPLFSSATPQILVLQKTGCLLHRQNRVAMKQGKAKWMKRGLLVPETPSPQVEYRKERLHLMGESVKI